MESPQWQRILEKLARVKEWNPERETRHVRVVKRNGLNLEVPFEPYTAKPPISESKLAALEEEYGVSLPASYREFLLNAANGIESLKIKPVEELLRASDPAFLKLPCELKEYSVESPDEEVVEDDWYRREPGGFLELDVTWNGIGFHWIRLVLNGEDRGRIHFDYNEETGKFISGTFQDWLEEQLDDELELIEEERHRARLGQERRQAIWHAAPNSGRALFGQVRHWLHSAPDKAREALEKAHASDEINNLYEWADILSFLWENHHFDWVQEQADILWPQLVDALGQPREEVPAPLWEKLGLSLMERGDERCLLCLELATRENDFHHTNIARYHLAQGALEKALEAVLKAPRRAYSCFVHGQILETLQRVDEAESVYREGIPLYLQEPMCHLALGSLLLQAGRLEEAEQEFVFVLQRCEDGREQAWRGLGEVRFAKGKREQALECLECLLIQGDSLEKLQQEEHWSWVTEEEWRTLAEG